MSARRAALLGGVAAAALVLGGQASAQRNDCRCVKVTASAGDAKVTGVGGLVTGGVLEIELTREFSFELKCDGTSGECVERVGVDATGMKVDLSDAKGNTAALTPDAGSETRKDNTFIVIDCTCKDKGGCTRTEKRKPVYGAKFTVPQWAIDDLAAKAAVTAVVTSTWTPKSETDFCAHETAAGYEDEVTTKKELKIKAKD